MNIIESSITEIKKNNFRPKKWAEIVFKNLKTKKTPFSISTIRKVFDGDFYNETVAIEIITVFEKEKKRQINELKKIIK